MRANLEGHIMLRGLAPLLLLGLSGCYTEGLPIHDLDGVVRLKRDAASTVITVDEQEKVLPPDPRLIGPVYLGLYSGLDYDFRDYPHPALGPGKFADAYPYGGTTIGDFRFACMQYFNCKMVSGRFVDFDDIVAFFNDVLEVPITDGAETIRTGEYIRQTCFDLLEVTSDAEVRITATQDRNGDGTIDASDLQFVEDENGDFVAEFRIWQADFFEGMTAWAYVDSPDGRGFDFKSCNKTAGQSLDWYDKTIQAGLAYPDVLNKPYEYLDVEDWVSSRGFVWNTPYEFAQIDIDFNVGSGDISELRNLAVEGE